MLSGTLPASLGNLTSLVSLNLHNNYLIGEVPASLASLTALQSLLLDSNLLTGGLDASLAPLFTRLAAAGQLTLGNNFLNASTVPAALCGVACSANASAGAFQCATAAQQAMCTCTPAPPPCQPACPLAGLSAASWDHAALLVACSGTLRACTSCLTAIQAPIVAQGATDITVQIMCQAEFTAMFVAAGVSAATLDATALCHPQGPGAPPLASSPPSLPVSAPPRTTLSTGGAVGIAIGGAAALAIAVCAALLLRRRMHEAAAEAHYKAATTGSSATGASLSTEVNSGNSSVSGSSGSAWAAAVSQASDVTLGKVLGAGATGTVYAGQWQGTSVAVKVYAAAVVGSSKNSSGGSGGVSLTSTWMSLTRRLAADAHDSVSEAEFTREVQLLSQLRHPNILAIYALVPSPRMLVMELGALGSLKDLLARTNLESLPWARRVELATGIASGVAFLHSQQPPVCHMDLKPQNVVLDAAWVPKLCDLGISNVRFVRVGTPKYMAPEMVRHPERITNFMAVDAWGLGVTLLEMAHTGTEGAAGAAGAASSPEHTTRGASTTALSGGTAGAGGGNSIGGVFATARLLVARQAANFAVHVQPRVPQPLARLITDATALDPAARPTAKAILTALHDMAPQAAGWAAPGTASADAASAV